MTRIEVENFAILKSKLTNSRFDPFYYGGEFGTFFSKLNSSKFKIINLSAVCTKITDGTHHTPKYVNEGVPFISVKDIREDKISFEKTKFITEKEHLALIKRCNPEYNDILFTKIGTVGIAKVVDNNLNDFSLFVSVALLKINHNLINVNYLSSVLNSKITKIQIEQVVKGIGVPDFHLENIKDLQIPLPPLPIQQELAGILDKAYKLKMHKEFEAKELLDSIDGYVMQELGIKIEDKEEKKVFSVGVKSMFGGRIDPDFNLDNTEKLLKSSKFDVSKLKNILSKPIFSGKRPQGGVGNIKDGIPSLGGEHVNPDGTIKEQGMKFVSELFFNKNPNIKVDKNSILLVKDGATTGKFGLIPDDYLFDKFGINEHLFCLKINDKQASLEYIFVVLRIDIIQKQIKKEITGGTVTGLTKEAVNKTLIPLPPLAIQLSIASEVMSRRARANVLQNEAIEILEKAKQVFEGSLL